MAVCGCRIVIGVTVIAYLVEKILSGAGARLLLERNYYYTIPQDKRKLLFDFYLAEYLFTLEDKPARGEGSRYLGQQIEPGGLRPTRRVGLDQTTSYSFHEALDILLPALRKELLDAVYYVVVVELRHVFDVNSEDGITDLAQANNLAPPAVGFLRRYRQAVGQLRHVKGKNPVGTAAIRQVLKIAYQEVFKLGNRASQEHGLGQAQVVHLAKILFERATWAEGFGGQAWANICDGWVLLDSVKPTPANYRLLFTAIDRVYDLQHNNGHVLTKLDSYYRDGYEWLKTALDYRFDVVDPLRLADEASSTMRLIALEYLKAAGQRGQDAIAWKPGQPWTGGIWKVGTWAGGTWERGLWEDGQWEDGRWLGGTWKDGVWKDGVWEDGQWHNGIWKGGVWKGGTWHYGEWEGGRWEGGTWVIGIVKLPGLRGELTTLNPAQFKASHGHQTDQERLKFLLWLANSTVGLSDKEDEWVERLSTRRPPYSPSERQLIDALSAKYGDSYA